MDTLRDFFEEEKRRNLEEAAGMPPLGMRVTELIAKQETARKKTNRIWWLTGSAGFLMITVFTAVYFREQLAGVFRWMETVIGQVAEKVTGIFESVRFDVISRISGINIPSGINVSSGEGLKERLGEGFIEKATAEISGWPVQIWYVVLLTAGVALLLGADYLVRHRRRSAAYK